MIDIEGLLEAISPETPCGEDLEYDPAYGALERAAQGKPEQQFGDTIVPAEEPDWVAVQRESIELLGRTKDLRIVAHLTRALARTQGWSGFRDGLALTKGLLERYWGDIHPQLDPDDDRDPTLRVNTIASLCDPQTMIDGLRTAPLVRSRALGSFSLRDLQIATKESPAPKGAKAPLPELQLIEAAFQEVELQALQGTAEAIGQSLALVAGIESLLTERVGADAAPDLAALTEIIETARKAVATPLAERGGVPPEPEEGQSGQTAEGASGPSATSSPTPTTRLGAINNRGDVIRAIDLLCDYYRRQEPSSPVPLLLNRAKRLVSKDFLEILQDLAPDGLSQAQLIRGPEPDA